MLSVKKCLIFGQKWGSNIYIFFTAIQVAVGHQPSAGARSRRL